MTANDLMIVIRARDEAAKALASVQGQLGLIVEAAQAANEAMAQIAETAGPAMAAASQAVAAAQTAAPQIDTQGMAAARANGERRDERSLPVAGPRTQSDRIGEVIGDGGRQGRGLTDDAGGNAQWSPGASRPRRHGRRCHAGFCRLRLNNLQNPMTLARGGFCRSDGAGRDAADRHERHRRGGGDCGGSAQGRWRAADSRGWRGWERR